MNDFLDFDSDLQFQPLKITSRGGITRDEIKYAIKVNILLLVVSTLILIPFDLSLIVFLGTIVAQSYNIKLKDTPLSGIVFVISFGLMALIPYIIENGYSDNELPVTFIISGLILAIIAHFVNDLVDYEIDIKRNSKSMVVTFGPSFSIVITVALLLFLAYLQNNVIILGIILTVIGIVIGGIKNSSYKIRELVYYFVALLSLLILLILPVE